MENELTTHLALRLTPEEYLLLEQAAASFHTIERLNLFKNTFLSLSRNAVSNNIFDSRAPSGSTRKPPIRMEASNWCRPHAGFPSLVSTTRSTFPTQVSRSYAATKH